MKLDSNYSQENIRDMQQDALQRVRDMQRRSEEALKNSSHQGSGNWASSSFRSGQGFSPQRPSSQHGGGQTVNNSGREKSQGGSGWQSSPRSRPLSQPESQDSSMPPDEFIPPPTQESPSVDEDSAENPAFSNQPSQEQACNEGQAADESTLSQSISLGRDTIKNVMAALNLDNERLLLLLLLFVLYTDGADFTLLFALLYLFL